MTSVIFLFLLISTLICGLISGLARSKKTSGFALILLTGGLIYALFYFNEGSILTPILVVGGLTGGLIFATEDSIVTISEVFIIATCFLLWGIGGLILLGISHFI